mgnify:CR=1 FL=1
MFVHYMNYTYSFIKSNTYKILLSIPVVLVGELYVSGSNIDIKMQQ